MRWTLENFSCDGFKAKTWIIEYQFAGGFTQETGSPFNSDRRTCYIPDTDDGRKVLGLLVKCFKRKLTFTVGFSVVRNRDNCIVWNGIHHKTNTHGGTSSYGFPDATYFNRVT